MKKLFSVLLVLIVLSSQTVFAMGFEKTDVPLLIAVNYIKWAENGFGVTDLRKDFDGEIDGDEEYTYVDDLIILDNPQEEQIQYIKLNYYNRGKDEEQQILRAMSMFAAIEFGAPGSWTDASTINAMSLSMDFYKRLEETLKTKSEKLADGKAVPFYVSDRLTYVLSADITNGIVITVV